LLWQKFLANRARRSGPIQDLPLLFSCKVKVLSSTSIPMTTHSHGHLQNVPTTFSQVPLRDIKSGYVPRPGHCRIVGLFNCYWRYYAMTESLNSSCATHELCGRRRKDASLFCHCNSFLAPTIR